MPALPFFQRTLELDRGRKVTVAAAALVLLACLPLPFGSIATALFFGLAVTAVVLVVRAKVALAVPPGTGFAVGACLLYFGLDALSVLYGNAGAAWVPTVASLHFLLFPVLLIALAAARPADPIRLFVRGARAGAVLGGAIAVIQVFEGQDRAVGGMINSLPFGSTAMLFAFLGLIGIAKESWRGRAFALVAFAAGVGASALSGARGGWLALPVLALILLVYLSVRHGRKMALAVAAVLVALSALVAVAARDQLAERIDETFAMFQGFEFGRAVRDRNDDVYTLDQRALMLVFGLEAIADRPILGYGPQNAVAEVRRRAADEGYEIDNFGHLHNEYLTETVGNGVVGLATLLLLLAAPVVTALRSRRDGAFAERLTFATMVSSGVALFGLTSLAFGHDILNSVYVAALLAVCLSAAESGQRRSLGVDPGGPANPGATLATPPRPAPRPGKTSAPP